MPAPRRHGRLAGSPRRRQGRDDAGGHATDVPPLPVRDRHHGPGFVRTDRSRRPALPPALHREQAWKRSSGVWTGFERPRETGLGFAAFLEEEALWGPR